MNNVVEKIFLSSFIGTEEISIFDCGNSRINRFFHEEASETENSGFGGTTIFFDSSKNMILGFYTISLAKLNLGKYELYPRFQDVFITPTISSFVQKFSQKEFPVLEILRIAVDRNVQHEKVGTSMILELYNDILDLKLNYNLPINSIYIDALYDVTEFYERLGFEFICNTDVEEMLEKYPMMITIEKIMSIISEIGFYRT